MLDLDTWQEVFSTLRKNVLRTAMTAWGIFWGTFMLVLMLGFSRGLQAGVDKSMTSGSNNIYVGTRRTSLPYAGLAPGRRVVLDVDDVAALRSVPGVFALAPGVELGRGDNIVTFGDETGTFRLKGETAELARVSTDRRGFTYTYLGRFFNEHDMERRRKVALIGETVRRTLFKDHVDPIGQYVRVRGIHFQVVGVFDSEAGGLFGERINLTVVIPFTTFQATFGAGNRGRVDSLGVTADPSVDPQEVEEAIKVILLARHRVHPSDGNAVWTNNGAKEFNRVRSLFRGIRAFVWFVCIATLMAGTLGVSNIMLISVKERTREFGVRKALGATPASIVQLVLREATVLTALAGYLGVTTGVLALELVARFVSGGGQAIGPFAAPSIDLRAALVATAVLGSSGILAGIAPARHAARIHPVMALRSE